MVKLKNCPLCNSTASSTFITCTDFTVSRETFHIEQCSDCGFKYTNPRPELSVIGSYYQSENYISHSNTKKGIINKAYQAIRKYTLVKKVNLINSLSGRGRLLDIGCGTGEFLNECQKDNWTTVIGIEPDEIARNCAKDNYSLNVFPEAELSTLESNSFDVITMWHVLEHVYNLQDRMKEVRRLLKKSGTLIIAVPNCSSFDASYYKEFWAAYDVPRHLYHFVPGDIVRLCRMQNQSVIQMYPMFFDSYYVSMLSENYRKTPLGIIPAICIGWVSNIKAKYFSKTPTFSSQVYIIRNV
jgi:2-polyprenyl-3-methyl-5-hydroxy-6-metoxy-1,4-benzoquinol methylase